MKNALEIQDLYKTYNNGVCALKGINLTVKAGDFFALLGANGAGKSTTIGCITGLVRRTSGHIKIGGYDTEKNPIRSKMNLGVVPQEVNLNVFENGEQILLNQSGFFGISRSAARARVEQLLVELELWDKRHAMVRHLSGGMKRRLMIARALVHKPKVLILDEPTAGVDIEIRRNMWDFLAKENAEGTTIILTTHYLEEAEHLCKKVAIIDQGIIVENTSMKRLLSTFRHQTFVFDTLNTYAEPPQIDSLNITMIDPGSFEICLDDRMTLNDVFAILDAHGIKIKSMRNKTNRLEEQFLDLIHNDR